MTKVEKRQFFARKKNGWRKTREPRTRPRRRLHDQFGQPGRGRLEATKPVPDPLLSFLFLMAHALTTQERKKEKAKEKKSEADLEAEAPNFFRDPLI